MLNVLKSVNLKLPEPLGPFQACNEIALHLYLLYTYIYIYETLGWDSVACIVNCRGLDSPGIKSWWGEIFHNLSRQALRPPRLLYSGYQVSFLGRDLDHPPQSSAKFKERVELYLYPHLGLHGLFQGEHHVMNAPNNRIRLYFSLNNCLTIGCASCTHLWTVSVLQSVCSHHP